MLKKLMKVIPALALVLAISSAAAPCYLFFHQPDLPEKLKQYE
jgi:cyclic lactone autoinducer peptide